MTQLEIEYFANRTSIGIHKLLSTYTIKEREYFLDQLIMLLTDYNNEIVKQNIYNDFKNQPSLFEQSEIK